MSSSATPVYVDVSRLSAKYGEDPPIDGRSIKLCIAPLGGLVGAALGAPTMSVLFLLIAMCKLTVVYSALLKMLYNVYKVGPVIKILCALAALPILLAVLPLSALVGAAAGVPWGIATGYALCAYAKPPSGSLLDWWGRRFSDCALRVVRAGEFSFLELLLRERRLARAIYSVDFLAGVRMLLPQLNGRGE